MGLDGTAHARARPDVVARRLGGRAGGRPRVRRGGPPVCAGRVQRARARRARVGALGCSSTPPPSRSSCLLLPRASARSCSARSATACSCCSGCCRSSSPTSSPGTAANEPSRRSARRAPRSRASAATARSRRCPRRRSCRATSCSCAAATSCPPTCASSGSIGCSSTAASSPGSPCRSPATVEPDAASRRRSPSAARSPTRGRASSAVAARASSSRRVRRPRSAGSPAASRPRGHRRSPLQAELDRLVKILLFVAIGLIVIVTGLGFLRGQTAGENLLAGISAAIAAIPEEPPILLAVVLGLGAYRLLKRGVLVRRLNAEETLGAIDLIITDKTGTLTQNRLEVASVRTPAGPIDDLEGRQRDAPRGAARRGRRVGHRRRRAARVVHAVADPGASTDGRRRDPLDPADLIEAEPVADGRPFSRTRVRDHPAGELDGRIATLAIGAPEIDPRPRRRPSGPSTTPGRTCSPRAPRAANASSASPSRRRRCDPWPMRGAHRVRGPAPRRDPRGAPDRGRGRDPDDRGRPAITR